MRAIVYKMSISRKHRTIDTVSCCEPFEYRNGALSRVSFPGGYVCGGKACHYIYDHQGNVRQVVDATTGSVDQENHYYTGGMLFAESSALYFKNGSYNLYRYGEKEFLTSGGLNLSLHGARMYDPALVRFITPDPLCHQTPHLSPYLYCAANPVMLTDPTGMEISQMIDGTLYMYKKINDQWGFYDFRNNLYTGDKSFAGDLDKIRNADPVLDRMITYVAENEIEVRLINGDENGSYRKLDSQGGTAFCSIFYNPECTEGGKSIRPDGTATLTRTPEAGLAHEFGHIFGWMHPYSYVMEQLHPNLASNQYPECQKEIVSCITENIYREATGQPLRISYTHNRYDIQSMDHSNTELRYSIWDKILMNILTIIN